MEADPAATPPLCRQLAAWCLRYAPLVAADPPDGIWIDVTGCAHLFGGEAALLTDLVGRLAAQRFAARAAIADTPGAAHAVARFSGRTPPWWSTRRAIRRRSRPCPSPPCACPAEIAGLTSGSASSASARCRDRPRRRWCALRPDRRAAARRRPSAASVRADRAGDAARTWWRIGCLRRTAARPTPSRQCIDKLLRVVCRRLERAVARRAPARSAVRTRGRLGAGNSHRHRAAVARCRSSRAAAARTARAGRSRRRRRGDASHRHAGRADWRSRRSTPCRCAAIGRTGRRALPA